MQTRSFRAAPVLALSALLTVGVCGSSMAQEFKLFGIKLLTNSYKDVLRKYGKPDEIQAGGPLLPSEGIPAGAQQNSAQGNFAPGAKGGGRMPGGGGAPSSSGGGGGVPPQYAQYARQGSPGGGGAPSSSGGGGGGLPGFGGKQADDGGAPQGAGGGGGGANSGSQDSTDESREVTWWYHDLRNGLHKSFLFNKDGRVIQIQEYGHDQKRKGDRTRKGVGLGSNLGLILKQYGWSPDGTRSGDNLVMKYGNQYRVAFQLVKNNVIGITIAAGDTRPAGENR